MRGVFRAALPAGSAGRVVFVFHCYLDDSGTSALPIVTLAGFGAPLDLWEKLEPAFEEILTRYNVPVLHTKEFHNTDGCFRGWRIIKKKTFADELFAAAHGKMLGISVAVRKQAIAEQKKKGLFPTMSPYGIAFSSIMTSLLTDPEIGKTISESGLSFFVESGNNNNAEIDTFFHQMAKKAVFADSLRSLSLIPKQSCRAIQIADFLAFYSRRNLRNHDRFSGRLALPAGPYLEIIYRHVPVWEWGGAHYSGKLGHLDDWENLDALSSAVQKVAGQRRS